MIFFFVSWPVAIFMLMIGTRIGRAISLVLFLMVLWNSATRDHAHGGTLTCSEWMGSTTCTGPNGYTSHESEWMGRTTGYDNRGNDWSATEWMGRKTITTNHRGER